MTVRFLPYVIVLVVTLYALIDAVMTPSPNARTLPRWLWLVLIVVVPFAGAVGWLLLGRPPRNSQGHDGGGGGGGGGRAPSSPRLPGMPGRRAPMAPDDDPAFLRKLEEDAWNEKMRRKREGGKADQV